MSKPPSRPERVSQGPARRLGGSAKSDGGTVIQLTGADPEDDRHPNRRAKAPRKWLMEPAMSPFSYSDVFSISHEREYEEQVCAGDLVRSGPNLFPHFMVIAVDHDKAWVRDVQTGADHLTLLSRCRRVQSEPFALAAA
jgi:hypothetical protein